MTKTTKTTEKTITVRGAREHNLKDIHVRFPKEQLVVLTGLSGSGKSSLAFDTIYAEGQRRYVESLSSYARQFLEMMQKPDVDSIEGLSPAISIEQKTTSRNPRSTVGTVTEVYDYMRLLWARIGIPYSPVTGLPIESQTVSQITDRLRALPEGSRILLLAPIVRARKGEYRAILQDLQKQGFSRAKIDGHIYDLDQAPALNKKIKHDIAVVVDRLVIRPDLGNRLADSVETCLRLADGLMYADILGEKSETLTFSSKFACPVCGFTIEAIEPRLFSFNNPQGACPTCDGLGEKLAFAPELIVNDENRTIEDGALTMLFSAFYQHPLASLARHYKQSLSTPWRQLSEPFKNAVLFGTQDGRKPFEGVIPNLARRWRETTSNWIREEIGKFQTSSPCESCHGMRLKPEALAVKIDGLNISEVTSFSIQKARQWFTALEHKLTKRQKDIAARILKEIQERLSFLDNVGLSYLTLSRQSASLSGGEAQRIRLASQIGSGLTGVLYVLDEPSIGLHQRDNDRLLGTLKRLRDLGNSVLVVEHDEDAIRAADYLIDMGPGAGIHGGKVVAAGPPSQVLKSKDSLTAQYLTGKKKIAMPSHLRKPKRGHFLEMTGARENNLKNLHVRFPLGLLTCVTGVSGSGKSTLVNETLYKALARKINKAREVPGRYDHIKGDDLLDKIVAIDQSPIGRTPRSNPATYTGAFTPIREWYAALPEAKARGYAPGRFSFNVKGGRCEACEGDGVMKIEMHFLPDVYVTCDVCHGRRYNRETLEITYQGKSIADTLEMTVEEGAIFFAAIPSIRERLVTLERVGLGYIKIGQAATTLSGGEAQRIKLAKELSRRATGKTLYILDEPTTGLHFEDVRRLLEVLHTLTDQGNSMIVIEHNLEVIKTADHIIDLGPEGGDGGGHIVAEGTPQEMAANPQSITGTYLANYLKRH
ncbi:MAG: excinuclease ABC subunit UvrA [Alphaproteobacteria bacterium]|nr:excinuclease ABC subunit UvrA [Alphaproteobacteria bacterium]